MRQARLVQAKLPMAVAVHTLKLINLYAWPFQMVNTKLLALLRKPALRPPKLAHVQALEMLPPLVPIVPCTTLEIVQHVALHLVDMPFMKTERTLEDSNVWNAHHSLI